MERLNTQQWHIYWIACFTVFVALSVRLFPLLPLYTDIDLRAQVQSAVQSTAEREGWLISGVSIQHVSNDSIEVLYRSYFRGADSIECYAISLQSRSLSACDAS